MSEQPTELLGCPSQVSTEPMSLKGSWTLRQMPREDLRFAGTLHLYPPAGLSLELAGKGLEAVRVLFEEAIREDRPVSLADVLACLERATLPEDPWNLMELVQEATKSSSQVQ